MIILFFLVVLVVALIRGVNPSPVNIENLAKSYENKLDPSNPLTFANSQNKKYKGFKDFLSTTEKERYKFHNAPARNTQQFMEYLPYAIAFGVEKEWAEVFKDIPLDQPSWYSSQNNSTFNAVAFTHNLSAFSTSVSSSSGSSGSSGAGSAGGGGGGGGGGSW